MIYFATESRSEFRVNDDESIERMGFLSTRFLPFTPAGTLIERLEVGHPCHGIALGGCPFHTSVVTLIMLDGVEVQSFDSSTTESRSTT